MNPIGTVLLEFDPARNRISATQELSDGLSVIALIGEHLWVANDETTSVERLSYQKAEGPSAYTYGEHRQFALASYLQLPESPSLSHDQTQEADIEGLDYSDGYLWLIGSHGRVRTKPENGALEPAGSRQVQDNLERLATVTSYGNRLLFARIPLDPESHNLTRELKKPGKNLTAAWLKVEKEGKHWQNDLTEALAKDEHLHTFIPIPGKDNGLDIEGLTVSGKRVFLGLRGPVLRGFALILELELQAHGSALTLKRIGPDDQPYRKHLLQLSGLGIRDLRLWGDDMLILAGPTMELDAPIQLFRWRGGADPGKSSLVWAQDLPTLLSIPHSSAGGYAEGMTMFTPPGSSAVSLLVVYDAARARKRDATTTADIFPLPL